MSASDSDPPIDDESTVTNFMSVRNAPSKKHLTMVVLSGPDGGRWCQVPRTGGVIGRHPEADIRLSDPAVSRKHAAVEIDGGRAFIRDLGSHNGVFVSAEPVTYREIRDGDDITLSEKTTLRVRELDEAESKLMLNLQHAATTDQLTGAPNRHALIKRLNEEVTFARRHGFEVSVMLVDVDHFKEINDTKGHRAGDMALRLLTISIQSTIRTEDVFGRYGGDEFMLVIRGYPAKDAAMLGERLRRSASKANLGPGGRGLTLSIGVADYIPSRDGDIGPVDLTMRADTALYKAKRLGRDRVVTWSPPQQPVGDYEGDLRDTMRAPKSEG